MKKVCVLILCVLLLLSLGACSDPDQPYTVENGRRTFVIDPAAGTITDGPDTYQYTFSGTTATYQFQVTFPDGSTYSWSQTDGRGQGGGSHGYSALRYADGEMLLYAVLEGADDPLDFESILLACFAICLGLPCLLKPHFVWFLTWGWHFKDAEPSKLALVVNQIIGTVLIVTGILLFFTIS